MEETTKDVMGAITAGSLGTGGGCVGGGDRVEATGTPSAPAAAGTAAATATLPPLQPATVTPTLNPKPEILNHKA